jgi:hypothetical protein
MILLGAVAAVRANHDTCYMFRAGKRKGPPSPGDPSTCQIQRLRNRFCGSGHPERLANFALRVAAADADVAQRCVA